MMNKKFSILLSLLLTLTMLFGSAVPAFATDLGEPGAAEPAEPTEPAPAEPAAPVDDPALNILARTLALKENVYVKYAVPANSDTVKMLFWTSEQTEYTVENAALVVEASYQQNVNGTMCNIFQYTGMLDHQMTDVLYARAYVENGNRYGEVTKYSILQYAYNKQNAENPDAELNAKLDDLLDKGAAAQTEQNYKTDDLANEPHSTVHVVDDVLTDGFKEILHPDSKPITGIESYLLLSGAYTYFIENGIQMLGYHLIESYIYYFDEGTGAKKSVDYDGHLFDKIGRIFADSEFVTLSNGNTYYLVEQIVIYNFYVINNYVYYFGEDGAMKKGITTPEGYTVNAEGIVTADNAFIDCGEYVYYLQNNLVIYIYIYIENILYLQLGDQLYPTQNYENDILESDNDENAENNDKLAGVTCTATIEELGMSFTVTSDENGHFVFPNLPMFEIKLVFVIVGYIEVTIYVDLSEGAPAQGNKIVLDRNVSNTLSGRVTIADSDMNFSNNASLAGATVTIDRISSTNSFTATTTTDYNGNYSFGNLTAGVYKLVVVIEGYIVVNQIVYVRHNETNVQNTPIEAIPSDNMSAGDATGTIVDARTGLAVAGLTVYIRAGLNNTTGEILQTVTTNASGLYKVLGLLPGNYTAQVVDEREHDNEELRFGTLVIAIKIMASVTVSNQNATVSNNVGFDIDGMRIVLTWGSTPSDLDSHLEFKLSAGGRGHVYYPDSSKNYYGSNGFHASLDVDDTSAYGPETITISNIQDGIYTYYIHSYTSGNSNLQNSGATITIYFGSSTPAYVIHVPAGSGRYWNVFTYNSVTGEFTIVNTITSSPVVNH